MESVRAGAPPTLRFYGWSPPCLSFGRNQPARGHYDPNALRGNGMDIVRRPTGGRAVLHDAEVTYSVAVADRALGTARQAYTRINRVLASALIGLGAPATIEAGGKGRAPVPSTVPCFAQPVSGEILAGGRKLVGSAQIRTGGVLLQHGSIPLRRSSLAAAVFGPEDPHGPGSPAYLEEVIGRVVCPDHVIDGLAAAWAAEIGSIAAGGLDDDEHRRAVALMAEYEDERWTWRG